MTNESILDRTGSSFGWYRLLAPEWQKSLGAWMVLGFFSLTCIFIFYQIFGFGDEKQISFGSDLLQAAISAAVVFLSWRVTRHPLIDDGSRRAWRIVTASLLAYSFGHCLWFYLSSILNTEPFPSIADLGFWSFYPLMLWALLSFPTSPRTRSERLKFVMDVAIVMLGGTMTVWHFVIRPTIEKSADGEMLMTFLNLSYVVGDLVLLLGIVTVLLRRPAKINRAALLTIVFGLLNILVADIGFAFLTLEGTYASGHWVDNFFISGMFSFLVAAHFQNRYLSQAETAEEAGGEELLKQRFSWLPYLGVAVGLGILLIETRNYWAEPLGIVIFASIGLTVLVVLRQMTAVKENIRLREERAARKSEVHFHTLIKDSSDITGIYTPGGVIKFISPSVTHILGYAAPASIGLDSFDFVHEEDVEALRIAYRTAAADHQFVFRNEYRYKHVDGSWRILEGIGKAFNDEDGKLVGILQNSRDVTDRKKAENRLRSFAARLEQSNRELEDFAYVASHDLQEPLRKVQAFGDRLSRKYAETLGEEGNDYVRRMCAAAGRMQHLINDLLTFSRVTTKAKPFRAIDLNKTVEEVLSDLEILVEKTNGQIEVGRLPAIDADPVQMRQLFQNLIGNALKFHRPGQAPQVRIFAGEDSPSGDNNCRIAVEDNGIGFDEKYTDRIFTVFQRLHGRQEYEGSGIGLAVCRKIVERHQGLITARSRPGEGSCFFVTLPITQTREENTHEISS